MALGTVAGGDGRSRKGGGENPTTSRSPRRLRAGDAWERGYLVAMCRRAVPVLVLLLSACTLPETVENLERESPPPELGRPGFVRIAARTGAWAGGAVGGV